MKNEYKPICGILPAMARVLLLALVLPALTASGADLPAASNQKVAKYILADAASDNSSAASSDQPTAGDRAHAKLFVENKYPSAATCRTCHPVEYREWSVSPHAYAEISPVFNAMQATIDKLTQGANGDFCIRCHDPVGMNLNEPILESVMDRNPTSREGITCVVCHRLRNAYGKNSGRFALVTGDILTPVYGPTGDAELKRVLSLPNTYRVVTNENVAGRKIHTDVIKFEYLNTPAFCGTCHDVTLQNGFRLEEAFSSYKNSPAARRGETCQDCHMGKVPGKADGYAIGPAAIVGGVPTKPRRISNHMFIGPDYSIVNRGFFPHNDKAAGMATMRQWLTFNDKAGWGTDKFENSVSNNYKFPPSWTSIDDRYDARDILDDQYKLLAEAQKERVELLRNGFQLGDLVVKKANSSGLKFKIQVKNITDGHVCPTGFDAERAIYLQVFVTDSTGKVVFKSGDLDPNGDVRDLHSTYVHDGLLPLDHYLFSLQSRVITTTIRGGEHEQVLPINFSLDPLPFIRPMPFAVSFTGRPTGARIQREGIKPLASRWAEYYVAGSKLTAPGPYKVRIRFLVGMVPINLIDAIKVAGFDYNMSPRQVADAVKNGQLLLYDKEVTLKLDGQKTTINLAKVADVSATHAYAQK